MKGRKVRPPRSGATAATDGKRVLLFGGYAEDRSATNDLWTFEDDWRRLEISGGPGPRLCSASAVCGGDLVIFGGWDPQREGTGGVITDDVWRLDLDTLEWTELPAMPRGPCSRHVAVAVGDIVVVHTFRCRDSVLVYDATSQTMREQPTTGNAPSSRGLHAAARCGRDVVVFGGADKSGTMRSDVLALDTTSWTWRTIRSDDDDDVRHNRPTPRAGATAAALDDHIFLVCCGAEASDTGLVPRSDLWALDLHSSNAPEWTLLIDDHPSPSIPRRNAATLTFLDSDPSSSSDGGTTTRFLLHGGWHPFVRTYDDTAILVVRHSSN